MRKLQPRALIALPALLLPLAGCGEKRIVAGDLEAKLRSSLDSSPGVGVKSVSCPDDVEVKAGTRFDCTAVRPNGKRVVIHVTLTNDKGGLSYAVRRPGG
jgi:Domain of unknown function (DUF4333)